MVKRIIFLLFIFLLFGSLAKATDYYVDADCVTPGTGTSTTCSNAADDPFQTLDNVESALSGFGPGDTIYFDSADTWTITSSSERFQIDDGWGSGAGWVTYDGETWGGGTRAKISKTAGQEYNPIVWIRGAASGGTDAYVKFKGFELDGNDVVRDELFHTLSVSYVQILNCVVHGADDSQYTHGIHFDTFTDAGTTTIQYLTAENNEVYHTGTHGIIAYPEDNHNTANVTITKNKIHDFARRGTGTIGSGIMLVSTDTGTISKNVIYDAWTGTDGSGIYITNSRQRQSTHIDINRNILYGGAGALNLQEGIIIGSSGNGTPDIDIWSNIIYATGSLAIRWEGSQTTGNIYNNTFYNIPDPAIRGDTSATITNLKNNIFYQTTDDYSVFINSGSITNHSNNAFYNSGSSAYNAVYSGSTYTYSTASTWEASCQDNDDGAPGFLNLSNLPTAFDSNWDMNPTGLRIVSSGTAYNNGTDLGNSYDDDIDDNLRSGNWDIGAYFYQPRRQRAIIVGELWEK